MKILLLLLVSTTFAAGFKSVEDPALTGAINDALEAWRAAPKPAGKTPSIAPRRACVADGGITRDPGGCCGELGRRVSDVAWECEGDKQSPPLPKASTPPLKFQRANCSPRGTSVREPSECCSGNITSRDTCE